MLRALSFRSLRSHRGMAKAVSAFTLLAYITCLFGHGLGEAITFAFSNHGHHFDIAQGVQGHLQIAWVHEPETRHSGIHGHDAENPSESGPADHDFILCENEATAIKSSSSHGTYLGIKALAVVSRILPVSKRRTHQPAKSAEDSVGDGNLRRLNSVLLRV